MGNSGNIKVKNLGLSEQSVYNWLKNQLQAAANTVLNTRISIKMENFLTTFLSYYESFNEDPAP
jgi:hypothetical protein